MGAVVEEFAGNDAGAMLDFFHGLHHIPAGQKFLEVARSMSSVMTNLSLHMSEENCHFAVKHGKQ